MRPERDRLVDSLCLEALARPAEGRAAFLDEACAGDPGLRGAVGALLSRADGFLERPAWEPSPLAVGTRLGPYEIEAAIESGGMGDVYRARDTRLGRVVAVKVLPPALAADPGPRERLEREARAIAGLNHPHICTLYDVGVHEGGVFLVLEHLAGETLASRLQKGPLPADQALTIAVQIADALAVAHRHGIIHRDLKPGNVMLTKAGAKLLDFGLARPSGEGERGGPDGVASSPAPWALLTAEGMIVGTLPYMAPEQLEGKPVDGRTDIFAFGTLVHEMLTGRRAFTGETRARLMAAIMTLDPPPVSTLQPGVPPALDRLVTRCLAKDPDDRWQTSRDLASELRWIAEAGSPASRAAARRGAKTRWRWGLAVAVLGVALVGAAWLAWQQFHAAPAPGRPVQFSVTPPAPYVLSGFDVPALSPDGTKVAFSAGPPGGSPVLFVRSFDSLEARMIPETAGANTPFWSPDGQQLGFFANRKLKTVRLAGGSPVALADGICCGTWGADGVILFTAEGPNVRDRVIFRIASEGGVATRVRSLDAARSESQHQWPLLLPDGRHYLYLANSGRMDVRGIDAASLDSTSATRVMGAASNVAFVPPGFLVFRLGGRLMAQAYDWERSRVTGSSTQVAEQVAGSDLVAYFSAVPNALAYVPGTARPTTLTWLDRDGNRLGSVGEPGEYSGPQFSPDQRVLAVARRDPATETRDIWLVDLARGTQSRFTFDPADDCNPAWSPDGSRIAFTSARKGQRNICEKPAGGLGEERPLLTSNVEKNVESWVPNGGMLLFNVLSDAGRRQLWSLPFDSPRKTSARPRGHADVQSVRVSADEKKEAWSLSPKSEGKPSVLVSGPADVQSAQVSPDGRFIAYQSTESGRREVFVQPFPSAGTRWSVSPDGGFSPQWRGDGKELFYISGSMLMAVDIRVEGTRVVPGIPRALFEAPFAGIGRNFFVPTRDGQRFLAILRVDQPADRVITVELNWMSRLKR